MRMMAIIADMAVLALLTQPAAAAHVWVFGDSNVDSGWYRVKPYSGNTKFDPDLARSLQYGIGKPTTNPGPMSVEVLAGLLGTNATPANQGGTNYATSGAKNVNVNTPANGGFPNAIPTRTQIANFLHSHGRPGHSHPLFRGAFPPRWSVGEDLFLIDSGANDISFAIGDLSGFTAAQQQDYLADQAAALAGDIASLQTYGASHIIVVGQPENFGNTSQQSARQFYDGKLRDALAAGGVRYAWADINQVRKDIVANPVFKITKFTTNAADRACPLPDPVLNITTAWALLCSARSPVTQPAATADQSLFADDQHMTTAGQGVFGSYFFCLVRATWTRFSGPRLPFPGLHPSRNLPFACSDFTEFSASAAVPATANE